MKTKNILKKKRILNLKGKDYRINQINMNENLQLMLIIVSGKLFSYHLTSHMDTILNEFVQFLLKSLFNPELTASKSITVELLLICETNWCIKIGVLNVLSRKYIN